MANKETPIVGHSDPSKVSRAAARLGLLLAKIRDELRQFLEAFQCAISGKGNVNWRGLCLELPDPGNGGTISFAEEPPDVTLSNFAIYRFNIPVSETDIDTAARYLQDYACGPDAQRLHDEFRLLQHAFCSLGDCVQLPDGVVADRQFYARGCAAALWEHVNELIGTVDAMFPAGGRRTPVVFISSTSEDMENHRSSAKDAALRAGFLPRMMEYFPASGEHPPLRACLAKISGSESEGPADVLVVIVAHRYGWVPQDQPDSERKSITWLECEKAKDDGKEILAFLVNEKHVWPDGLREENRIAQAVKEGRASPELMTEVRDNVERLGHFKTWLGSLGTWKTFTTPESLTTEVLDALHGWRQRHAEPIPNW